MKNIDYLEAFVDYLFEEEKSQGTISGYQSDVKDFIVFIKKDITDIKRTDITAYKEYLRARKLKTLSINRKLVSVKQFIDFVNDRFSKAITARIKQEKIQKQYSLKDEELLSEMDYTALINMIEANGDIRTKAMFDAMYYSGMRVSEMLQLKVRHVMDGQKVIEDIKGKGGKYRPIFISDKLIESLKAYYDVRVPFFDSDPKTRHEEPLFIGQRGSVTRQTVHNLMKKYAVEAGIPKEKAHAHNLRHLFGLRLAAKGVAIQDIAKFMGHTSIEVTKIYLEKPQSHYANMIDQL